MEKQLYQKFSVKLDEREIKLLKRFCFRSFDEVLNDKEINKLIKKILGLYKREDWERLKLLEVYDTPPFIVFANGISARILCENIDSLRKYYSKIRVNFPQRLLAYYIWTNLSEKIRKKIFEIYQRKKFSSIESYLTLIGFRNYSYLDKILVDITSTDSDLETRRIVGFSYLLSQFNKYYFTYAGYLRAALDNPEFSKEILNILKKIYVNRKNKVLVRKLLDELYKKEKEIRETLYRTWKADRFIKETSPISIIEYFSLATLTGFYKDHNEKKEVMKCLTRLTSLYKAFSVLRRYEGRITNPIVLLIIYMIKRRKKEMSLSLLYFLEEYYGFYFKFPENITKISYLKRWNKKLKKRKVGRIKLDKKRKGAWYCSKVVLYDLEKAKEFIKDFVC